MEEIVKSHILFRSDFYNDLKGRYAHITASYGGIELLIGSMLKIDNFDLENLEKNSKKSL